MSYELRQFVENDLDKIVNDLGESSTAIGNLRYWLKDGSTNWYWAIDDRNNSYLIRHVDTVETGTADNKYIFYSGKPYNLRAPSPFTTEICIDTEEIDSAINIESLKKEITKAFKIHGRGGTPSNKIRKDFDDPFIPVFSN
jgi:hypothetical protein